MSRDEEIRKVAAQLDGMIAALNASAAALAAILDPPGPDSDPPRERVPA